MKSLPKLQLKKKILASIVFVFVFSIITVAAAQEVVRTITVTPPSVSLSLSPGESFQGQLKVINQSSGAVTFKLDVKDFIVVDNVGTPNILPQGILDNRFTASSWIAISPSVFTIKPGQKQFINYYIKTPSNARPGGHYAAVSYTTSNSGTSGTGVAVSQELGTLFSVGISGPIAEQAQVTKFFTQAFQEYGPVQILTEIKNLGDLHIAPKGSITVSGLFANNKVLPLDNHNIFPGGVSRDFNNSFNAPFLIGRYKAVLLASYGLKDNLPLSATLYFWVFPWRLVIVIVLIIIAIALGVTYLRKRKKNHPKDSEEPKPEHKEPHQEPKTTQSA